jgi:hypothetical protein
MANKLWFQNGKLIFNSGGNLVFCEDCPCCVAFLDTYSLTAYTISNSSPASGDHEYRIDPADLPLDLDTGQADPDSCDSQSWQSAVYVSLQRRTWNASWSSWAHRSNVTPTLYWDTDDGWGFRHHPLRFLLVKDTGPMGDSPVGSFSGTDGDGDHLAQIS